MSNQVPEKCQRCEAPLDGGYSQRIEVVKGKHKLTETVCFRCDEIERWQDYANTGVITTHIFFDLISIKYHSHSRAPQDPEKIASAKEAETLIDKKIKEFESSVWFGSPPLQPVVSKCRTHGMKYAPRKSDFVFMAYDMAGRTMMTIENKVASISVITATDETCPCMGLQGICATKDQALELLGWAINNHAAIVKGIKSAPKVGMF